MGGRKARVGGEGASERRVWGWEGEGKRGRREKYGLEREAYDPWTP